MQWVGPRKISRVGDKMSARGEGVTLERKKTIFEKEHVASRETMVKSGEE